MNKKYLVIYALVTLGMIVLFVSFNIKCQTIIDVPAFMVRDTLDASSGQATVTRDIWFNFSQDSTRALFNEGNIDLDIYPIMWGDETVDTLSVSVWGLKKKVLYANKSKPDNISGKFTKFAIDSTYLGTVVVDSLLHTFAVDISMGSDIPLLQGLRVEYKTGGGGVSDPDSVIIESNLQIYFKDERLNFY